MNTFLRRFFAVVLAASVLLAGCAAEPQPLAQVPTPYPTPVATVVSAPTPTFDPDPIPVFTGSALLDALRRGGYVVFVRHAPSAPAPDNATPPAAVATIGPCEDPSRLTDEGRAFAEAMGQAFRAFAIPVEQVLSSPICRTLETAQLAFGGATIAPDLFPLGAEQNEAERDRLVTALRRWLSTAPPPGTNIVLVGHNQNLEVATGIEPSQGEAVVFEPLGEDRWRFIGRIKRDAWAELAQQAPSASP